MIGRKSMVRNLRVARKLETPVQASNVIGIQMDLNPSSPTLAVGPAGLAIACFVHQVELGAQSPTAPSQPSPNTPTKCWDLMLEGNEALPHSAIQAGQDDRTLGKIRAINSSKRKKKIRAMSCEISL